VSSGRPAATKPLHPGRTPTKFNNKPGPKGHGFNSLLPPISPAKISPTKVLPEAPAAETTVSKLPNLESTLEEIHQDQATSKGKSKNKISHVRLKTLPLVPLE
ncbi:hypothetical protein B0H10DRAFT_1790218, partial [Mycena sp. CBHHK59/15]